MLHRRLRAVLVLVIGLIIAFAPGLQPLPPPAIDVWYGAEQRFGDLGLPQRFVNVLGNVASFGRKKPKVDYSLNGGPWTRIPLGPDQNRLASVGDFNVEIDAAELYDGPNHLVIRARPHPRADVRREVAIHFASDHRWPLPYAADFADATVVGDAAQIVDGRWAIVGGGARTLGRGYDRILAVGDMGWRDYEVTVEATIHDFTPPRAEAPNYGVTHFGIGARWKGHHGGDRPRSGWFPIGAATEFTLDPTLKNCRWRILAGSDTNPILGMEAKGRSLQLGRRYVYRMRVSTADGPTSVYRVKMWPADEPEPTGWDLEARETGQDYRSGAALLVAHHTDVTIWRFSVMPVADEAPPSAPAEQPAGNSSGPGAAG